MLRYTVCVCASFVRREREREREREVKEEKGEQLEFETFTNIERGRS